MRIMALVSIAILATLGMASAVDEVTITAPQEGQTFDAGSTISVRVRYYDDDGNGDMWSRLLVDGKLSQTSIFKLGVGPHIIRVEAADNPEFVDALFHEVNIEVVPRGQS